MGVTLRMVNLLARALVVGGVSVLEPRILDGLHICGFLSFYDFCRLSNFSFNALKCNFFLGGVSLYELIGIFFDIFFK